MSKKSDYIGYGIGVVGIVVCLLALLLSSCRTIHVVPEVHDRDSVRVVHDTRYDSIYIDRWHTLVQKGDTVFKTDSVVDYRYIYLAKHDTIEVHTRDSIPYPVEVEKQVRYVPGFYKWSTWVCWIIIVGVLIYVVCRIAKVVYLRR